MEKLPNSQNLGTRCVLFLCYIYVGLSDCREEWESDPTCEHVMFLCLSRSRIYMVLVVPFQSTKKMFTKKVYRKINTISVPTHAR